MAPLRSNVAGAALVTKLSDQIFMILMYLMQRLIMLQLS